MGKYLPQYTVTAEQVKYAREWGLILREILADQPDIADWTEEQTQALSAFVGMYSQIENQDDYSKNDVHGKSFYIDEVDD